MGREAKMCYLAWQERDCTQKQMNPAIGNVAFEILVLYEESFLKRFWCIDYSVNFQEGEGQPLMSGAVSGLHRGS